MAEKNEGRRDLGPALAGGGAGIVLGILATLGLSRPVEAAPPEERLGYLISLLEQLVAGDMAIIDWLSKINTSLGALGVPGVPGIEVTVLTPWVAKEPETIFEEPIRAAGVFFSSHMVNWTKGKRLLIKAESSLDQPVQIQAIGNMDNTANLATDIGAPAPCPANGNASIGAAWDDWQPYIGVRITAAVAPVAGILLVRVVIQE